jgi:hypothetical protein
MNNVENIGNPCYHRPHESGVKILLAGKDRAQMEQVKALLPGTYKTTIWELSVSGPALQKAKRDVVVLVGSPVLSYLRQVKSVAGLQTPIIGYELKADANERVQARAGGIICLVNHSPEEMELTIAIENVVSWAADKGGAKRAEYTFQKETASRSGLSV